MDKPAKPAGRHLLTSKEAAEYLGFKNRFLEKDRARRHLGIPFYRISKSVIRYDPADLDAFMASCKVQ